MADMQEKEQQETVTAKGGRGEHLIPFRYKPGQSGNPKGRPKGKTLKTLFIEQLEAEVASGKLAGTGVTVIEAIIRKLILMARRGDFKAIQEILNRYGGKVADVVQHEGLDSLTDPERQGKFLANQRAVDLALELDQELEGGGNAD